MRRLAPLLFCLGVLCAPAVAQGQDSGDVKDCTPPGVLTAKGVKLGGPAKLLQAIRARNGSVEAAFEAPSGKSLVFEFGGIGQEYDNQFKVINKCRIVSGDIQEVESKVLPAGSKEAQALTEFLTSWVATNLSSDKRSAFQRLLKLSGGAWWAEFDKLSEAEQNAYWICELLQHLGKPLSARGKRVSGTI